jgi:uncharacterized protein (TIGR00159 family)
MLGRRSERDLMLDSLRTEGVQLLQTIRWADALDVIVVSFILFSVISWARRSAARNMVVALLAFGVLYLVSRGLDMYLTRVLLEAILAVAVLTAVIVFQDDIRRFLDRMGAWPLGQPRRRSSSVSSVWIDDLVSASEHLADSRTGALIAVRGSESWDRSIRGGISLDGQVSRPLLLSIFDRHSAGHDGAVLVERDRIARFATHLPLSSNQDAVGRHGTRHAAAVGLSESCDALLIVVSEETGMISVAERGALISVASAAELRDRLEQFQGRNEERHLKPWKALGMHHGIQNVALAAIVSVFLWFFFAHQPDLNSRTFLVPIELRGLSDGMTFEEVSDTEARVTLEGTARALDLLNEDDIVAGVDLSKLSAGAHLVEIRQKHLNLPVDISLSQVEPRFIRISARKKEADSSASEKE